MPDRRPFALGAVVGLVIAIAPIAGLALWTTPGAGAAPVMTAALPALIKQSQVVSPAPTPTPTPTVAPGATPTRTPTPGATSTPTATTAPSATPTGTPSALDLTRLPIGGQPFGKISAAAVRGSLWSCQTSFSGGGASATGPWYNASAGTYNILTKPTVNGAVAWVGQLTFSVVGANRMVTGNSLPSHTSGTYPIANSDDAFAYDQNPHSISAASVSATMPASPTVAASPRCAGGSIGILFTGPVVFNGIDAGGRDAVAHEMQDACGGHPQQTGVYHYHSMSPCVSDPGSGHSAQVGYAWDGFGIYGYRGVSGNVITNAELDECHGHSHEVTFAGVTQTIYHYHGNYEFPYVVGCLRGASGMGWNGG